MMREVQNEVFKFTFKFAESDSEIASVAQAGPRPNSESSRPTGGPPVPSFQQWANTRPCRPAPPLHLPHPCCPRTAQAPYSYLSYLDIAGPGRPGTTRDHAAAGHHP